MDSTQKVCGPKCSMSFNKLIKLKQNSFGSSMLSCFHRRIFKQGDLLRPLERRSHIDFGITSESHAELSAQAAPNRDVLGQIDCCRCTDSSSWGPRWVRRVAPATNLGRWGRRREEGSRCRPGCFQLTRTHPKHKPYR
jgi:hypothetical protein